MIARLVRLSIRPDAVKQFLAVYRASAPLVRAWPGCSGLELWQQENSVFITYSVWTDEESLESYRSSDTFRSVWSQFKPLFARRAAAESFTVLDSLSSPQAPRRPSA